MDTNGKILRHKFALICVHLWLKVLNNEAPMVTKAQLKKLAKEYGTPLFVVDHEQLRKNLAEFDNVRYFSHFQKRQFSS